MFKFKNLGHFFAVAAQTVVKAAHVVQHALSVAGKDAPAIAAAISSAEPLIEGFTGALAPGSPGAIAVERAIFHVGGDAMAAVAAAGGAADASGLDLHLDQEAIAKVRAALAGLAGVAAAVKPVAPPTSPAPPPQAGG